MSQPLINSNDFIIQNFKNLQNVSESNMNLLSNNLDQKISAYNTTTPAILNGVFITQSGTSNIVNVTSGQVRFQDQTNIQSTNNPEMTLANIPAITSQAITVPGTGSSPQYYIAAQVVLSPQDNFKIKTTASILTTAMTYAAISASPTYVALFTITTPDNVNYTIATDTNCIGYLPNYLPDIVDDVYAHKVTITGAAGLAVSGGIAVGGNLGVAQGASITGGIDIITNNLTIFNGGSIDVRTGVIQTQGVGGMATLGAGPIQTQGTGAIYSNGGYYGAAGFNFRPRFPAAGTLNNNGYVVGDNNFTRYILAGTSLTAFWGLSSNGTYRQVVITGVATVNNTVQIPLSVFGLGSGVGEARACTYVLTNSIGYAFVIDGGNYIGFGNTSTTSVVYFTISVVTTS